METQNGYDEEEAMDGAILSVHVQNFFCHDNFRVEFKKRVTFIVGRNGSGKSAILTALVVGLGGKALDTNRGKNFQSFVKKGANSASIEIKIKNSGPGAYKPEEYGDKITIVKTISASGASNYKIKSSSGKFVHSNAKEVNAIVSALNIQVNNPISVLNQDDARDFSLKMDPKKLYSLFMRATNLDSTEENYERARTLCANAIVSWERKNKFCLDLKNEYNKWKKLHEQMRSRKDIEKQLKLLKAELCWSQVADLEREVAAIRQQCERQRAKCQCFEDKLQAMEQTLGGTATEALEKQLAEHKRKKEELERQLRPLERAAADARAAHSEAGTALARHADLLHREKRRVQDYEREIESGGASSQRELEELERRAERGRAAAEEARARIATLRNDAQQARSHSARLANDVERAHAERSRLTARLKQRQQELRELQSRGADSLAVYGGAMSELCRRVAAATERGHFSAPPRGPVGQYIKVKDKQWAGVLEHIIGGLIRSFCVNTPEDSRKLFKIMDQVWSGGGKPTVTCSAFLGARHDVRASSVRAAPHSSALQALLVEDTVVANFLIDNLALERVLLVPDHETAVRLADTPARVPPNCAKIVTLDCSEYHPAPDYRSYGGRARPARYLHLDTDERKRQLRTEIQELESELQQHNEKIQQLTAEQRRAAERDSSVSQALKALGAELLKREAEADAAAAARDMLQAPQQAVLDDELNASKQRVQQLTEKLSELTDKRERCMRDLEDCEAKMSDLKAQVAQVAVACRTLSEEISQEEMNMDRGAAERRGLQQRLSEERAKLTRVEEILSGKQEDVASRIQAAKVPRMDNPREASVITNLLADYKKKMNSLVQTNISREEVERELAVAERNYGHTQQLLDTLRKYIDRIEKTAAEYLEYCCKLKNDIGRHIGIHFMATLTTRGYHGQIHIDHQKDELMLKVSGREGSRSASSTASLSGGERSYTTVAFITSLWECVDLPFYFMDEFDVFMDDVNQQIAVTLLLDMAARLTARQFVFLTPHGAKLSLKDAPVPADVISLGNPRQE
ncbi:structural maintenance of chromosomes protein 6 [Maniola jurtina]|uniref:structural maintenance of chromosomes protein 6 n=1 Tax=Maniola jurtina TaxID=191418 RepID=UPI001E68BE84|nr:structural maintenance of chromosomes protein 6 [Maniola jurtina]